MSTTPPREALRPGTHLDCYRIIKLIGSGGFSLIYLAEDEDSHDEVAIKEYFPKRFGHRSERTGHVSVNAPEKHTSFERGRRLFYQEANILAQLDHPNIVRVRNCFLANNTAYLVMDYEPGKNLGRYIKKRNGNLSTNFLMTVFPPLLDALDAIHATNNLHLDIKPSNIHLRPGGNPLLLDFGAVYHLDDVGEKKAQVITPGFSPIEQYYTSAKVGPCSDVYAIGASMRACIEGRPPPSAVERHAKDELVPAVELFTKLYPRHLLEAVDWAMRVEANERPQTALELRKALLGEIAVPKLEAKGGASSNEQAAP
ncbi:serine/threonine protein kinase [endosymbiont of unidentified scaly snail isolate Monju]|uniref:serine/threonine protein kinase n=1 Tax=endosymbiont of unidentified scaly snail isolate Monju TaxID=1248727 RepID=UPI0003892A1C|nr:serine/threonine-protein kinase [endosymbiont of unidentified scaly snail isolate Monju]BAN69919.1 serine/threonine protein kinase [endosymbiont of unidentified scaly snail isolate Monju]